MTLWKQNGKKIDFRKTVCSWLCFHFSLCCFSLPSLPFFLLLCLLQVVEIALKVSPVLSSHMFQPLLPPVFRGIVEGEVSST